MNRHHVLSFDASTQGGPRPLAAWEDAVSLYVGRTPDWLRQQEYTRCEEMNSQPFRGSLQYGALGRMNICRLIASPNRFTRSFRMGAADNDSPLMLFVQRAGQGHFEQQGHSGTLEPGDWCLLDTRRPFSWTNPAACEQFILAQPQPRDVTLRDLAARGLGQRFSGRTGVARLVQVMLSETFGQLDHLPVHRADDVSEALCSLMWSSLHEQLEEPAQSAVPDTQLARLQAHIEAHLCDPDLSVVTAAKACGISVRSAHRAFAGGSSASVSTYIWQRRVARAAVALRDPAHAHCSITELAYAWGFSSPSHFSRVFRDAMGCAPREYRASTAR